MTISKTKDADYLEDPGDLHIKSLLASLNPDTRVEGIERLDEAKREQMFLCLRCWSSAFGWRLHGQEIGEIWQATLLTIWLSVEPKRFERERGRLNPFVRKITYYRALDLLRHRGPGTADIDWEHIIDARDEGPGELPIARLRRVILARFEKLSPTEKLVVRHLVRLFRMNKRYSLKALVDSINKNRSEDKHFADEAVKSAKARAFRKLRGE